MTVKVKPLVWVGVTSTYWDRKAEAEKPSALFWEAETILACGGYQIMQMIDERFRGDKESYSVKLRGKEMKFPTIEAAKAAVQADYEARILAAIEAPAQKPVAWRAKDPKHEGWWIYFTDGPVNGEPLYTTPPDHLALVAAAYRDAAGVAANCKKKWVDDASAADTTDEKLKSVRKALGADIIKRQLSNRTPADAEAHLTSLLRAEYERGVREAAERIADTCPHADVPGGNCTPDTFDEGTSAAYEAVLALLTQEGR